MTRAQRSALLAQMTVVTLANLQARKAVRQHWYDQGMRLSTIPVRKLVEASRQYLAEHPELIEQARARCAELLTSDKSRKR